MTTSFKVRIYELAKELKLESKRVIEEARREGADVSVPSNSISRELAEKIRNKYFPKKEAQNVRSVRVVKRASRSSPEEEHPSAEEDGAPALAPAQTGAPGVAVALEQNEGLAKPFAGRIVKKLAPATRAEQPEIPPAVATETNLDTEHEIPVGSSAPVESEPDGAQAEPAVAHHLQEVASSQQAPLTPEQRSIPVPPANQVRVLRPTTAALNAGVRQGEKAPVPAIPSTSAVAPAGRERDQKRREERPGTANRGARPGGFRLETRVGTPGETATPQTTYIPPPDTRRPRPGRSGVRRGPAGFGPPARRGQEGRGDRFERDFVTPRTLSLEDRIIGTMHMPSAGESLKPVRLIEGSTVKEFAEKLGIKPKDVVSLLLQRGVFATINQPLNDDVAVDLGKRFGFEVSFVPFEEMVAEEEFEELIAADADDVELPRSPVVTVMGHVDHGKTSLLDAIRVTNVAEGEAGGITQHIGAYSVNVPSPDAPGEIRRVVFLDTPGHEAFTMMRARGARATDVVVLVVAADDGVMPQTVEAIEHARAAGVPILVAINKIDRPDANPDRVRQELANQGLQPVEWGGDVEMVQVSAKRRQNIDTLLETILLTADILNLKASPTRLASGVVLEAKLDRGRGSVATVLVQQGTLRIHDPFIVGQISGKVRAMFNDRGEAILEAGPSTPVEVLGLQGVPQAGEAFQVVADITRAQTISQHRQMISRQNTLLQTTKRGIEALGEREVKELLVVLKADVQGSVEVLKTALQKLSTDAIKVKVIRSGAGAITESDVLLAYATQAGALSSAVVIIGFNVRPEVRAAELAKNESVDIRLHSIIYKVEEEIRAAMIGMLEAVERERILGKADVREIFRVPRFGTIAGSMVLEGTVRRNARARLIRDGVVSWEGVIASLRRFKEDVSEVRAGFDCGIGLENFSDIKVGDQIEAFVIDKIAATEL